jgi:transposase
LVKAERIWQDREPYPTIAILDSKSIRNTDTAKSKGYDAGKKVSGIKLHLAVDILGLPLAIYVTTADKSDKAGAKEMLSLNFSNLLGIKKIMVDGGYSGTSFADFVKTVYGAEVEIVKRNELHKFEVLPKRWIIERSFGWLEKNRRLWKNCERILHTSKQFTVLAFISILLKRY